MFPNEPTATAFLLVTLGVLMGISVLFSRASGRFGVPVALGFIAVGMIAGSEGLGGIAFDDYGLAFRLGTVALVLILFDGGLNTPLAAVRESIKPAAVLATLGVVLTGAAIAVVAHLLGFSWVHALLIGAVVSSTDAAAVFSVLRGSGIHLKKRVGATLELESGLNDPMAVILTMTVTHAMVSQEGFSWWALFEVLLQMLVGGGLGVAIGYAGLWVLRKARLAAAGLYPVATVALAFLTFGVPTLFYGSGFLAVYVAAVIIGNRAIRYRSGVLRVHDALAWLSQVGMFLVLGLLANLSELARLSWEGLALGLALAIVARPVAVVLCLLPFGFKPKEIFYIGVVGLRGAVPIILATYPVLAQAPGAMTVFNVVFFVVLVNTIVPGTMVKPLTRRLGLVSGAPPTPEAVLEIATTQVLKGELVSFFIEPASAACGATIADLPFPQTSTAALIVRGGDLIAPKGPTLLEAHDHVYVFCQPDDLPFLKLVFGQQEQD